MECGTGNWLWALAPHLGRLTGLDLEPAMLEQAAAEPEDGPQSGRLVPRHGSALDLPFPDAAFDAALTNQMLHPSPGRAG